MFKYCRMLCQAFGLGIILVTFSVAISGERQPNTGAHNSATLASAIDRIVDARLQSEQLAASPRASDAEFLRRVYLDIIGVIPPADKAAAFLKDSSPTKYAHVIDELLADSRYGRHMADIWHELLIPVNSDNRRLDSEPIERWLERQFNRNAPWDRFVTDLLTAKGTQEDNPAVTFFLANATVDKMTDSVSRLFMGVQLQCAQCHNHPFTPWKQNDYWGMAAFFSKVNPDNPRKAAKQGVSPGVQEGGRPRKAMLPESAKTVPAKFPGGAAPKLNAREPNRPALAQWLTAKSNPYFARAMVNRIWAQFFGRGLVHPVDDLHDDNPPSHPDLLAELAQQFVDNDFDIKFLIRAICNSKAYQRTSKPLDNNAKDQKLFSHMYVKSLTPQQLYDSLVSVVGANPNRVRDKNKNKQNKTKRGPGAGRAQFVAFFRVDDNSAPTDYDAGIPQALRLMNSSEFNRNAVLVDAAMRTPNAASIIETLCLGTLTRRPTDEEAKRFADYVGRNSADKRKAYDDVLWVLLNSSEFALNH